MNNIDHPAPILDAHIETIWKILSEHPGRRIRIDELAQITGIPIGTMRTNYFQPRLAARGIRVERIGKRNARWYSIPEDPPTTAEREHA